MWHEGTIGLTDRDGKMKLAHYWVKAFDEGSEWGINEGRISKLSIKIDGKWVVNYDRGWDIKPDNNEIVQRVYNMLLEKYN